MKRLVISEFDENGSKWYHSPHHKEVKTGFFNDKNLPIASKQEQDVPTNFHLDNKLRRDKFYDFFRRATINGEPRINIDELNRNLTIKIDELPDSSKISLIFEDLDSKSSLASRGKKNWSEQEIIFFVWLVMNYCYLNKLNYMDMNDKEWDRIAEIFPGRNSEQCKLRWQSLLKMNLSKAPWTQEEDEILVQVINDKGPKKWKEIAIELNKRLGNLKVFRQGKQCRERWINHLDPTINRGAWTAEEDIKLLQTHLDIGKRWAEIAKILKNRTENAVKNRWNSLIKKYKNDYGYDSDAMSTSSAHSTSSINDLEKKISEIIISQKRKKPNSESPDAYSQGQMQEVPEEVDEESNGYDSGDDASGGTPGVKNEPQTTDYSDRKMEDSKESLNSERKPSLSNAKRGKRVAQPVGATKSALMDFVTKDMERKQDQAKNFQQEKKDISTALFPQQNNNLQENLNLQNLMQGANLFGLNNNPNFPGLLPPPQENLNNTNALNFSLLNHLNGQLNGQLSGQLGGVAPFNSLASEMLNLNLNLWKASPPTFNNMNNMNLINQNLQQNDLASNLLGMYSRPFQPQQNTSSLTSLLPNSQNFLPDQNMSMQPTMDNLGKNEGRKQSESTKMNTEDKEPIYHKLIEKPFDQLVIPDQPTNSLQHAIVDTESGHIYFLSPVNKDNLPISKKMPSFNNNNGSLGNIDIFGNSPALNNRSWTSPTMNNNPLFNNSLNQLASLNMGRNAISPQLGLIHDSPNIDRVFFGQNFNVDRRSNDWTPEQTATTPLSMLSNRARAINQINGDKGAAPPGNAGTLFSKRPIGPVDKSKNNSFSTNESSKFDSPSSFLESGQNRGLNFKAGDPTKVPVRQQM